MAQITTKKSRKSKAADVAPPSDLAVLHPEHEVQLSVGPVTVREYGNVEWLRLLPSAEPLVASMTEMLVALMAPSYEDVLTAIARHTDDLLPLIAQSVDQDMAWIDTLKGNDLETLLMHWWGVNGHFFVRRAQNRIAVTYQERAVAQQLTGEKSTPSSSPTATGPATSAATPPAS